MDLMIANQPRVFPYRPMYQMVKRVLDVLFCLITLPIVLPVMGLCGLAIAINSPGPVLFIQERIGKGGKPFRIYKFRTLQNDLDDRQNRAFMKAYVKGQITEVQSGEKTFKPVQERQTFMVGRILRRTSLDELPQIFNVLRGEMSIVGPRPNVTWEVEAYNAWHYERLEVLPGITGLAQVRGRSSIEFNALVRNDIEYIEKQGFFEDVRVLWWTFLAIVHGEGA